MRVAGFWPGSRVLTVSATSSASSAVVEIGPVPVGEQQSPLQWRQQTVLHRIHVSPPRSDWFGAGQPLGHALPRVVSMRISSGPSKRKLKPRAGLSICGELTPDPSNASWHWHQAVSQMRKASCGWKNVHPDCVWPAATASGSRSKAKQTPTGTGAKGSGGMPPRPKVASHVAAVRSATNGLIVVVEEGIHRPRSAGRWYGSRTFHTPCSAFRRKNP